MSALKGSSIDKRLGNQPKSVCSFSEMNPQLLFSDGTSISLFDTKTGNISILADGYRYILFLDCTFDFIVWSDFTGGTISR